MARRRGSVVAAGGEAFISWPQSTEYNAAIQNLRSSVSDEELREGEAVRGPLGMPLMWSGGFADVYKVRCPTSGNT